MQNYEHVCESTGCVVCVRVLCVSANVCQYACVSTLCVCVGGTSCALTNFSQNDVLISDQKAHQAHSKVPVLSYHHRAHHHPYPDTNHDRRHIDIPTSRASAASSPPPLPSPPYLHLSQHVGSRGVRRFITISPTNVTATNWHISPWG